MRPWRIAIVCTALICSLQIAQAQIKAEEKPTENPLNWEISVLPKPTPEEMEAMRWAPVLENEMAKYEYDAKSLKKDAQDADLPEVTIKAIYKDKKLLEGLNRHYKDKLASGDAVGYSEIRMLFRLRDRTYAIPAYKVYSQRGVLVDEQTRESKFALVPSKTFADTMYEIVVKALQSSG